MDEAIAATLRTFSQRAKNYDLESEWNSGDATLLEILRLATFGQGLLLDLCGGTGLVAQAGVSAGWSPILLDLSKSMLDVGISRGHVSGRVVQGDAAHIPLKDASIDLIVCRQGLQYLDRIEMVGELQRVAKQAALSNIVVDLEEDSHFWSAYFEIASPGRRSLVLRGDTSEVLRRAGFRVIWSSSYKTHGPVLGPVKHLPLSAQVRVIDLFTSMSKAMADRYELSETDGELRYAQHWEVALGTQP